MEARHLPRVKICCVGSAQEARLAVQHGAAALGLVSDMPSGPGVIPEELIAEIAAIVPPGVASFLLTSLQSATRIVDQQRRLGANTIQICDRLKTGTHLEIRAALPGISIVQVIHVNGEQAIQEAVDVQPFVDAVLLDSGKQDLAVKELGGTGRCHNWQVSRQIRELLSVPVYLAGGLRSHNVNEAIETVGPFGVDVCSGVRTEGDLDSRKLAEFIEAVQGS